MLKIKIILVLTLFIVVIVFNLPACTDTSNELNNTDKITETSTSEENNSETGTTDETQYNGNIWSKMDFLIMTDYPNSYDGAPIAMGSDDCGRDSTGEMSISEMIDSIDNMGNTFLPFTLDAVQGLYLKFSFNSNLIPAEIKDIYYINGNDGSETDRHYLDNLKVPEEIGVYNFFVNLEWNDGTEEVVYFRVKVIES